MDDDHSDVTLGELNRNLQALRVDTGDMRKDVTELRITAGTQIDRTRRLEAIVYGALGTATAALITAVITLVTLGPGG